MNYSLILACDTNGVVSVNNQIPWMDIKNDAGASKYFNDLRNFRALTNAHVIIMGSKTYETLPGLKLLQNRLNVVLSSRPEIRADVISKGGLAYASVSEMHKDLQKLKKLKLNPALLHDEIFVIGGIEVYNSMKDMISTHYITVIPETCEVAGGTSATAKYYDLHLLKNAEDKPFVNNLEMQGMKFKVTTFYQTRPDYQFVSLMERILSSNNDITAEKDRTNFGYYAVYGEQLKFDISNGKIPLTTLRNQPFRWIVDELLWFLNGHTDNKILKDKNISIWNGNTTADFLKKRKLDYPEDIAGPIYGFQWRHWGAPYNPTDPDGYRDPFEEKISKLTASRTCATTGIDQLTEVIKNLSNPDTRYGRRHIISGWNVSDLSAMALPPCHVLYQFSIDGKDQIHTTFYQRSSDVALACSWNAASAALMTNIIGCLSGLKPATLTMFIANAHIYKNHISGVQEMLKRMPYEFPTLTISNIYKLDNVTSYMVNLALSTIKFEHFKLNNYFAHPDIALGMNV